MAKYDDDYDDYDDCDYEKNYNYIDSDGVLDGDVVLCSYADYEYDDDYYN